MKKSFLAAVAFLLVACGSPQTASQELHIAVSPAAQPASAAISACLPRDENIHITFDEQAPNSVDLSSLDFYLQLGPPQTETVFSAQLASENVVLVVQSSLGISSLTRAQAADLLSGRVQNWSELGGGDLAVQLWTGSESDESRQAVETTILLGSPIEGGAQLADPQQLLDAVAADPGAAGVLPRAWVDQSVKVIDLGIQLPLLAIASQKPSETAKAVIACLQGLVGQNAFDDKYQPFQP